MSYSFIPKEDKRVGDVREGYSDGISITYTHKADKLFVADGFVRFIVGGGALGTRAVAVSSVAAAVITAALAAVP